MSFDDLARAVELTDLNENEAGTDEEDENEEGERGESANRSIDAASTGVLNAVIADVVPGLVDPFALENGDRETITDMAGTDAGDGVISERAEDDPFDVGGMPETGYDLDVDQSGAMYGGYIGEHTEGYDSGWPEIETAIDKPGDQYGIDTAEEVDAVAGAAVVVGGGVAHFASGGLSTAGWALSAAGGTWLFGRQAAEGAEDQGGGSAGDKAEAGDDTDSSNTTDTDDTESGTDSSESSDEGSGNDGSDDESDDGNAEDSSRDSDNGSSDSSTDDSADDSDDDSGDESDDDSSDDDNDSAKADDSTNQTPSHPTAGPNAGGELTAREKEALKQTAEEIAESMGNAMDPRAGGEISERAKEILAELAEEIANDPVLGPRAGEYELVFIPNISDEVIDGAMGPRGGNHGEDGEGVGTSGPVPGSSDMIVTDLGRLDEIDIGAVGVVTETDPGMMLV